MLMSQFLHCPYDKGIIEIKDKHCHICNRLWMPMTKKNIIYLQEINGNVIIPLGRFK